MLSFLRNNSVKIVYGIIISFIVTTFLGVIFFNDSFKASRDQQKSQQDRQAAVALIGDLPVTRVMYQLALQRVQGQLPETLQMTHDMADMIQLNALNQSIQNTLLLTIGKEQNVAVDRNEINTALYSVMTQFDVTTKKELKQKIQAAGGRYDAMLRQLKDDIIVSKTRQALMGSVVIRDTDTAFLNKQYYLKTLYISPQGIEANVSNSTMDLFQEANDIRNRITGSASFDIEFKRRYPNIPSPISFDWVTINQLPPVVSRALVTLTKGEISQPIKVANGYVILELNKIKALAPTATITEDRLAQDWARMTIYQQLEKVQAGREIKVLDMNLNAIKLKSEGRLDEAIQAYQGMISQSPANPYPHLFIARLQLMKGDISAAKQSLLKAEIKESLVSDTVVVPEIHLLLAQLYDQEKFIDKRNAQYDAVINGQVTVPILTYLKDVFESSGDTTRLAIVTQKIEAKTATPSMTSDSDSLNSMRPDASNNFLDSMN
ncbi:MAG: SurA N-terminal domain-containing protein [Candidatus Marinamargulisbacteria bacterium]